MSNREEDFENDDEDWERRLAQGDMEEHSRTPEEFMLNLTELVKSVRELPESTDETTRGMSKRVVEMVDDLITTYHTQLVLKKKKTPP